MDALTGHPGRGVPTGMSVGNAVPGVPSAKFDLDGQILPQLHRIAAFGGWNAGDGVPYAQTVKISPPA